jgi:hypothetical protein
LGFLLFEFLGHLGLLRSGAARGQRLLHFFRQALLQVVVDLARAGIEDAVDAEVEFGAVNLEDLAQLGDEFVVFAHVRLLVFAQVRCAQAYGWNWLLSRLSSCISLG